MILKSLFILAHSLRVVFAPPQVEIEEKEEEDVILVEEEDAQEDEDQ